MSNLRGQPGEGVGSPSLTTPPPNQQNGYLTAGQLPANLHLNYVAPVTTQDPHGTGTCIVSSYDPTVADPAQRYTTISVIGVNLPYGNDPTNETQQILLTKPSQIAIRCRANSPLTGYSLSVVRARTAGNTVPF
jgi:hypothetical protein